MNNTKEHILKTSLLLFLQKSYKDVTMKDIVEKTGLSKGAFYHYFTSKEELFKEITDYFLSMGKIDYNLFSKESFNEFYHQYATLLGQSFKKMIEFVNVNSNERTAFNFFFIMFEASSRLPDLLKIELDLHKKDVVAWKKIISTARKKGEIESNASDEQIAEMFLCCIDGVSLRMVNNNRLNFFRKDIIKMFDCLYDGLKT
jgi:TetR/AcrR family transcriptional regulator, transcriptional repressor for nem operon